MHASWRNRQRRSAVFADVDDSGLAFTKLAITCSTTMTEVCRRLDCTADSALWLDRKSTEPAADYITFDCNSDVSEKFNHFTSVAIISVIEQMSFQLAGV